MEEEKAVAYYEELTRKGEGAARFKQGLGFSSSASGNETVPARGSAIPSSSSFLSQFVRAASPGSVAKLEKDSEIRSIKDKLKKKSEDRQQPSIRDRNNRESSDRRRSRSREKDDGHRSHRRRSRSRSRSKDRNDRDRRHSRRSRSRERHRDRQREKDLNGDRGRRWRSRSLSPKRERRKTTDERRREGKEERGLKVDYSQLIEGYDEMSAAERVKAKMKLQLAETSEKDTSKGAGWERFEFDKDAPMDDEEVEVADDDAALVKRIGQSFRFSAIEARREEQIKAAHDEAMFGAPAQPISLSNEDDKETSSAKQDRGESNSGTSLAATSLLSEKVLAKQRGSWRDRARR